MKYKVGQILFVILNKKGQVYPVQVIEEITKKTLRGEEVNYVLQGGSESDSTIMLDKLDGEIFDSAEEAKNTLISRATEQIENIVASAIKKSIEWYSKEKKPIEELKQEFVSTDDSTAIVHLPDGTKARLKV